jgi:hypothetical protein
MPHPEADDVIIRQRPGDGPAVFLLGTPAAPDQFILRTSDEAVSHARRYARHQRVRAWLIDCGGDLTLLVSFRQEEVESAG